MGREDSGPAEGTLLWQPSAERQAESRISGYRRWLEAGRGLRLATYDDLWRWSVTDLEGFWGSLWEYFDVKAHRPYSRVLAERVMPGARWFAGGELNYAEQALRRRDEHPAVVAKSEGGPLSTLTYAELYARVSAVAASLRRLGVGPGDRVVAYMPNIPETLIAFLATASIGAVWSSCSPDFGARSVADRFRQIEPKVLFAVDGYRYNGQSFEILGAVDELQQQLPTLAATVVVPYLGAGGAPPPRPPAQGAPPPPPPGQGAPQPASPATGAPQAVAWAELLAVPAGELTFTPVPFDHPLWVLYSSGTTGLPKAIVQGHGGILLEHLKSLALHLDLDADDRFFWFTTTGWMMWNFLISGLLLGATVVLYDGSPAYPDMGALWQLAEEAGVTYFGASAAYLTACAKAGIQPGRQFDLKRLHGVGSTGAPLPPSGFQWVYEHVGRDLLLGSVSGGTDLCTAFVTACPLLPVHAGEIQCRALGAQVEALGADGQPCGGEVGELVISAPMPSMPLSFWGDSDGRRLRESYFDRYPGIWRHGDWVKVTERGTCVIYGRSDSTPNRAGVRMGTSEFYRVVEELPEIMDSLVIDTGQLGREGKLWLFVVLREGAALDEALVRRVRAKLRAELSPRHVPDEILAVPAIPRTLNGKKLEVPVKRILAGLPPEQVVNPGTVSDPQALARFAELAQRIAGA